MRLLDHVGSVKGANLKDNSKEDPDKIGLAQQVALCLNHLVLIFFVGGSLDEERSLEVVFQGLVAAYLSFRRHDAYDGDGKE